MRSRQGRARHSILRCWTSTSEKGNELLSDIFLHSAFPENDVEKEKGIIKEEIKMVEDTPDDYIYDLFNLAIWGDEGIGQAVLGKRSTIKNIQKRRPLKPYKEILRHKRYGYGMRRKFRVR